MRRQAERAPRKFVSPAASPQPAASLQPAAPAVPPARPILLRTATWALAQTLHPRRRSRGLRNLWLLARVLDSASLRPLWYSLFDPFRDITLRPDVAQARGHSSVHYGLAGAWESADPSSSFSTHLYWQNYPDVAAAGLNPLLHFIVYGRQEGRIPTPAQMCPPE
jgi:hypothetical protein